MTLDNLSFGLEEPCVVYDLETYPNVFTATFKPFNRPGGLIFEISPRRNDLRALLAYLCSLKTMIGFNNMGFDWPILHYIRTIGTVDAEDIHLFAMDIIQSGDRFVHTIWNPDIVQVDLFLINHFNNRAKSTSLKKLEFNMRSELVQDLPFPVGSTLNNDEIDVLLKYNVHDVLQTEKFANLSRDAIELRLAIEPAWLNQSDTGLGRKYFERELEARGVLTRTPSGPINTRRPEGVRLGEVVFPYLRFKTPVISQALDWYKSALVSEHVDADGKTYRECYPFGEASDKPSESISGQQTFELDGVPVVMGLGGLHASIDRKVCRASDAVDLVDVDVTSFYLSLAIKNGIYPEHLGPLFCEVADNLLAERLKHPKTSPTSKVIKRALNSVFGSSGSYYTCFADLKYLLGTTINGQFLILSLAEYLLGVNSVHIVQINTDGITLRVLKSRREELDWRIEQWTKATQLKLEVNDYRAMWIRDVNNYIAEYADGKRKYKGCYELEREWHKNHSMMIVPKAAEAAMCDGKDLEMFIAEHSNYWDFLLRLDLSKVSFIKLGNGETYRGVVRYYVSEDGYEATKFMPKTTTRIHGIGHASCSGKRGAWTCDDCGETFKLKKDWQKHSDETHSSKITIVQEYDGKPIKYDMRFYASEAQKLLITDEWEWNEIEF